MSNLEIVDIKNNIEVIKNEIVTASQVNMINGLDLDDFIYHKFLNRIDPVEYCEDVLRAHLPKSRQKLHENQTALIRAVCNPKLKQVAGMMSRQSGKCLAKGTKVLMADRTSKCVEDVVIGDKLLSPYGNTANVIELGKGREKMYEIKGEDGSSYTVNESHILSLKNRTGGLCNINVKSFLSLLYSIRRNLFGWRMNEHLTNYSLYPIEVIEKDVDDYYGFSLDSEDKLFMLEDYTVTHNTESISSFCGYLIDNYPMMRVGIFTPRLQQAEVSIGRLSTFFQMNEDRLNNKIVKITKDIVELDNGSYVTAVSASDQSNIEGLTFDVIVLDEAQKVSDYTFSERILPMGGGCLVGTSSIQMLDGTTKTLKELVEDESIKQIPCIDFDAKKIVVGNITQFCDTGEQETIKVTLVNGDEICGTFDHPVITKTNNEKTPKWRRLDEITSEMRVAIPRKLEFFGDIHELYARFFGLMIGDGNYSYHIRIHTKDIEVVEYIKSFFGESARIKIDGLTKKNEPIYYIEFSKLRDVFRENKLYGVTGINKKLPYNWQKYDKYSICELIAGLFDTDGSFIFSKNSVPSIELTSISYGLLKELKLALLKIGVKSILSISKKRTKQKMFNGKIVNAHTLYKIRILKKDNIDNFFQNIRLLIGYKQEKLNLMHEYYKTHDSLESKVFKNTDVDFSKVKTIEHTGIQHVYDLTVDKYHSFIANNIFVHNTNAKIVQVGTPKTRNHFYDAIEGKAKDKWTVVKRDWTQTPQNWLLEAIYLPDPKTGKERPYSRFIVETAMPKVLKEQMFPNNPEVWTEGNLSVEDFKTQYMLEFIDGAGKFLTSDDVKILTSGEYSWLDHGIIGEHYVAGIDFAGSNPDGDSTQITVLRITRDGIKQKVFAKEFNDASYPEQMYYISNLFGGYRPRFECKKIFADYTGCGAAVVQTLQEEFGLKNIEGIIFNARDKYTNSGMNLKNAMYGKWRQEFDNKKFQYPTKERFCESKADGAGAENLNYYHRMVGEWADLEQTTTGYSVNKKIEASSGSHDDVCDADVLANFAAVAGQRSSMPKPTRGRFRV